MNKNKIIIALVAVVIVVAGAWYVIAKKPGSSMSSASPMPSMSMQGAPSGQSTSTNPTATSSVSIQNFAFSPTSITVKKGTTVTWTNKDSIGHTVTETDGQTGPSSGTLNQGQTYSFTYNKAGTFHYECKIHPYMTGSVTVSD